MPATIPEFEEVRLDEKVDWGFSGGPEFDTSIVQTQGGFEQRNVNRSAPLHRYRARHAFFSQAEHDILKSFFQGRRGRAVGFRFMDPGDFASDMPGWKNNTVGTLDLLVAPGLMVPQPMRRGVTGALGVGSGSETQYQLVKAYLADPHDGTLNHSTNPTLTFAAGPKTVTRSTGSWITDGFVAGETVFFGGTVSNDRSYVIAAGGVTATVLTLTVAPVNEGPLANVYAYSNDSGGVDLVRVITKPVRRSNGVLAVRPFVNAVAYTEGGGGTGFSINTATGVVTFNVAPPAGATVTADFLYDVPVRFDSDLFSVSFEEFQSGGWENLELVELRLA